MPSSMGDSATYFSVPSSARSPVLSNTGVVCVWKPAQPPRELAMHRPRRISVTIREQHMLQRACRIAAWSHTGNGWQASVYPFSPAASGAAPTKRTCDGLWSAGLGHDVHSLPHAHWHRQQLACSRETEHIITLHCAFDAQQSTQL